MVPSSSLLLPFVALSFHLVDAIPLIPLEASHRLHAKRQGVPGITIQSSCSANFTTKIETALSALLGLSGAALDAVNYPEQLPYSAFFPTMDATGVQEILQNINRTAGGSGDSVQLRCDDPKGRCVPTGVANATGSLAYSVTSGDGSGDYLVICSSYKYPATPDPCAPNALTTISMADTLLHELTHMRAISGDQLQVGDLAYGAYPSIALNDDPNSGKPVRNADNYLFFSRWSWLALYGDGRPDTPCRGNYTYMDRQAAAKYLPASTSLPSATPAVPVELSYASIPAEYANNDFSKRNR